MLPLDGDVDLYPCDGDGDGEPLAEVGLGEVSVAGEALDDEGVVNLNKWFDKKSTRGLAITSIVPQVGQCCICNVGGVCLWVNR